MMRLLTSATDQIGASARPQDLLLNSNIVEGIGTWSRSLVSWQRCNLRGYAGELTARTARQTEPWPLPRDATEWWEVANIPVVTFNGQTCLVLGVQNGALLRLSPQRDLSDFTDEPVRDSRWRAIVQEGLGTTAAVLVNDTKIDSALSDVATVDCIMFCEEHAILDDLQKCLAKVKEQFSNVVAVKAELDRFPSDEYEEEGHVHIRIEVAADQDTAFREYDEYTAWALDAIEGDKVHYFLPTVSRIDVESE